MADPITKSEFARRCGVGRSCVTAWVKPGKLDGALVMVGRSQQIDEEAARRLLGRRLDVDQRVNVGRAKLGDDDSVTTEIKTQRLRQLVAINAKLEAEAAERAGKYVAVDA